ncbi:MAG: hypothetical protein CL983_03425 [Euryarchaeota archaeon]|nr:hypothetical protein [Euryarchaeota archaeon]|tara:strand:+ start:94 stop:531 length:438 start_codon:yes stop_codon:yes gene_type:complete
MSKVEDIVSQYLHTSSPLKRKVYVFLGLILTFFAIIGIFIPGWPTVSWAVPAAFLFSLSSERLFRWSLTNRFFGSAILEYYSTGKTIPKHSKYIIASLISLMSIVSAIVVFRLGDPGYGSATILFVGILGIIYVTFIVKSRKSEK